MVRKLAEAGFDELLHGGRLVDYALHDIVDPLNFDGSPAPSNLFLRKNKTPSKLEDLIIVGCSMR